jgi:hypothetical protein
MALDFNLLRPTGGPNPVNSFLQGQQFAQDRAMAQQNAMLDRETAQQKMAQEQEINALRRQQLTGQIQTQEETRAKNKAVEKTGMFRERLLRARTPEDARNLVRMQYSDPDLAPILSQAATLEQALAEISDDPTEFEKHRQQEAMGMAEWMKSQLPKTVGNAIYLPSENRFITAPREPAPVAPTQPVAVLGPDGRPQYVSREQAIGMTPFSPASVKFIGGGAGGASGGGRAAPAGKAPAGYRYTPTGDLEPIPGGPAAAGLNPKDIQKREATYPQATASVKSFETNSEQFIRELEKLRDDPGLNQITGPIYGRTPSVSREGSRAQSLYDKIFAKGGFQALQDMREASKTGGALGNVSNEEGRRLEKSTVGGLDRTQNIKDVQQGINDFIDEIRVSQARVREAYDTTYAYKSEAPAGAASSRLSSEDKAALDWANANPKDPRSTQIKQRLGVK